MVFYKLKRRTVRSRLNLQNEYDLLTVDEGVHINRRLFRAAKELLGYNFVTGFSGIPEVNASWTLTPFRSCTRRYCLLSFSASADIHQ